MAFRSASTATYTFASGSTGSTVDLGANNNYRYINATNVYNKGKADAGSGDQLYFWYFTGASQSPAGYWTKGIKNSTWTSFDYGVVTICDGYLYCSYASPNMYMYIKKGACYAGLVNDSANRVGTSKSVYNAMFYPDAYQVDQLLFNVSWNGISYTRLSSYGIFVLRVA